jgi:hypothetical protein
VGCGVAKLACFYCKNGFTKIIAILIVTKGQLISKCPFDVIVWTTLPPKNLTNSALPGSRAEFVKFFGGKLVQTMKPKGHFEIN